MVIYNFSFQFQYVNNQGDDKKNRELYQLEGAILI